MKSLIVRGDQIPSEGAKQASSLPAPNPPEHEFRSLLSGRVTLIVQTGVGEPALVRLIPLIPQVHQRIWLNVLQRIVVSITYSLTVRSFFRRFVRIVPYITSVETKRSNRCTSIAQRIERTAPKRGRVRVVEEQSGSLLVKNAWPWSKPLSLRGKKCCLVIVFWPQVGKTIYFLP